MRFSSLFLYILLQCNFFCLPLRMRSMQYFAFIYLTRIIISLVILYLSSSLPILLCIILDIGINPSCSISITISDTIKVVFSVNSEESAEEAKKIIDEIREKRSEVRSYMSIQSTVSFQVPIILIANKIDLFCDEGEWKVRGMASFAKIKSIPIVKMSAKDSQDVSNLYHLN